MSPRRWISSASQKVQYIGLSIGGMIGQAFAIAHGQRLISAMLVRYLAANAARRSKPAGRRASRR